MTAIELKEYIYKNNLIELILKDIGCGHIKHHKGKDYYSASNIDGDNEGAINVYNSPYLNVVNYTRQMQFDGKADILTLVQYNLKIKTNKHISFGQTIKYLHHLLNLPLIHKDIKEEVKVNDPLMVFKKVKNRKTLVVNDIDLDYEHEHDIDNYVPYIHEDLFREGIIGKTIKKFSLAYTFRYKRTVFPLRYWLDGRIIGYNKRTSIKNCKEFGIKKYLITLDYPKQINLYGLWENKEDIEKNGYITVVEAEKSVLKRDSRNDSTCVALSGHTISEEQVRIILGLNIKEVVICFDKDIDINEVRYNCEKFYRIRNVSYIHDKWGLIDEHDSPCDAHNKIYEFLFKHRVVYDNKEHEKFLEVMKQ